MFFLMQFYLAGGSRHANNSGITKSTLLLNNSNSLSLSCKRRTKSYVNTNSAAKKIAE